MDDKEIYKSSRRLYRFLIVMCAVVVVASIIGIYLYSNDEGSAQGSANSEEYTSVPEDDDPNKIVDGIHVRTGFIEAPGMTETINNCTNCHSAQLVIQNRMNEERWISTIRWMQKTQNLWDLGENEKIIVDYLVTNYPPVEKGRRQALTDVEWYKLGE
ncbi:monoheme cytochrome C [Maribacter halichondriae]|uniref:monoheme cytochrome C n=1 Tax=Maribacter halichondriae TaxID=2980554 RepID=UPI002359B81D|nr:monoheme cytochrome C [Maribacter sp. Hal144]